MLYIDIEIYFRFNKLFKELMMKLSIVVCVYDTPRKYLSECFESISRGTLCDADYEILVIDDGSSEDYSDIINAYGARVIKTENRGIFRARLLGIEEAKGDYIAFVDSDDTVSFNYHFPMLREAEERKLDVCFNDWAFHTERTKYACLADSTISGDFTLVGDDILLAFAKNEGREHSYFVLWNKLFKASLLKDSLEELKTVANGEDRYNYSEDTLICFFAFKKAKIISNIHTGYYFYRIHSNQTVNIVSEERLISHIKYMSKTLDIMQASVSDNRHCDEIINSFKKWAGLMSRTHYSHAKANKYCHLYDFIKESYHIDTLKRSTLRDSSAYSKNKVLPFNLPEIEDALIELWNSERERTFCLCNADEYMRRSVRYMRRMGKPIKLGKGSEALPKPRVKLKDRILMNKLVYTVGLILFKKGSRLRAFLKKHI